VHVVGTVRLVVAELFDAGETLEPPARRVDERLVDPEIVRAAASTAGNSGCGRSASDR